MLSVDQSQGAKRKEKSDQIQTIENQIHCVSFELGAGILLSIVGSDRVILCYGDVATMAQDKIWCQIVSLGKVRSHMS